MEDRESWFIPSRLFGTAGQKWESTDKLKDKKMSVSSKVVTFLKCIEICEDIFVRRCTDTSLFN